MTDDGVTLNVPLLQQELAGDQKKVDLRAVRKLELKSRNITRVSALG